MKYWAKSLPPLFCAKGYLETTKELFQWIDKIVERSRKEIQEYLDKNPTQTMETMLRESIVLKKVHEEAHPEVYKMLKDGK